MLISLHLGCVCPSVTLISFLADEFSIAAITNYRKFNGLKQDTFITAQLFRSEVRHNSHQAKIKVLTGLFYFSLSLLVLEASGKLSFLAVLFIETNHVPWFLSTAPIENDGQSVISNQLQYVCSWFQILQCPRLKGYIGVDLLSESWIAKNWRDCKSLIFFTMTYFIILSNAYVIVSYSVYACE